MGFVVRVGRLAWSLSIQIIRTLLPHLLQLLRVGNRLSLLSVISLRVGVPTAMMRITDEWTVDAEKMGFPVQWEYWLRPILRALAGVAILAGLLFLILEILVVLKLVSLFL